MVQGVKMAKMPKTIDEIKADFGELTEEDFTANWGELLRANPDFAKTFDRRVSKGIASAMETEETKRKEAAAAAAGDKDAAAEAERKAGNDLIQRKAEALKLAIEKNLDPGAVFEMLGIDDATDAERIEAMENYGADKDKSAVERILKANGRNMFETGLDMSAPDLEAISNMTEAEQRNLGDDVVVGALEKAAKSGQKSYRDMLMGQVK
jgi:hypothetical protein